MPCVSAAAHEARRDLISVDVHMVRPELEMERSARLATLVDAIRSGLPFGLRPLVLGWNRSENTTQQQSSVVH